MGEPLAPRSLGPQWRLQRDDAHAFRLERSAAGEPRRLAGLVLVGLASTASAWALVASTPDQLELVTWPPAALLAVVGALSVPAAVRAARRLASGVALELTFAGLSGTPVGGGLLGAPRVTVQPAEVQRVLLHRREDGALRLCSLEVELAHGGRLEGPLLAVAVGEDDPLGPVAARLADRLGCPLAS
jgi:hypothetical protein